MADQSFDILIVGGGMAGASLAAHLSEHADVHIVEMEDHPGYHSTGRSAALFSETYGNATIRALSRASRPFFFSPPDGFSPIPLVKPRDILVPNRSDRPAAFDAFLKHLDGEEGVSVIGADRTLSLCPVLQPDGLLGGALVGGNADIEVHELHHGYLRAFKTRGGTMTTGAKVTGISREKSGWTVSSDKGSFHAGILVNAAGAWADELGSLAQAQDIGLQPRRRTVALIEPPEGVATEDWPMLLDAEEQFYMKPDAGLLLLSPADETLTAPCDAQPDEMDIAIAVDRLQTATTLEVRRIRSKWAGLRSFVEDRSPVVGYDGIQPAFFWMAALGGYGIQTAPALGMLAASLLLGQPIADELASFGLRGASVSPERLR